MIRFYCDGCEEKLEAEQIQRSSQWSEENYPNLDMIWCDGCIPFVPGYLEDAGEVWQKADEQCIRTKNNHRAQFFRKARQGKMKAVK